MLKKRNTELEYEKNILCNKKETTKVKLVVSLMMANVLLHIF